MQTTATDKGTRTSSNKFNITSVFNMRQIIKTQYYHEGQRGEEEADDQFDVRSVAHDQPQALTEGEELGSFSHALYNQTVWRREQRQDR